MMPVFSHRIVSVCRMAGCSLGRVGGGSCFVRRRHGDPNKGFREGARVEVGWGVTGENPSRTDAEFIYLEQVELCEGFS